MFIELTDHLRCPADHDESYLVLLPEVTDGRSVRSGTLGCPVCRAEYRIEDGVVRFAPKADDRGPAPSLSAAALHVFLGLSGPGGHVALVGDVTALAAGVMRSDPGVHVAAVRPVAGLVGSGALSLIDADRLPFKRASLRGVVLGAGYGEEAGWVSDALGAVLPGLRVVGAGAAPKAEGVELLAAADGWWVGRKKGEERREK